MGIGTGRVREGWAYGVPKTKLTLKIEWILSEGLGTNSGHWEVWIGVPVQCYTPCNMTPSSRVLLKHSATPFCCGVAGAIFCLKIPEDAVSKEN